MSRAPIEAVRVTCAVGAGYSDSLLGLLPWPLPPSTVSNATALAACQCACTDERDPMTDRDERAPDHALVAIGRGAIGALVGFGLAVALTFVGLVSAAVGWAGERASYGHGRRECRGPGPRVVPLSARLYLWRGLSLCPAAAARPLLRLAGEAGGGRHDPLVWCPRALARVVERWTGADGRWDPPSTKC